MEAPDASDVTAEAVRALEAYAGLEAPKLEPLGNGLMHSTFAVHDPSGEYVLQRVHPMFSGDIHANIVAVTRHLSGAGIPTPELIPTAAGAAFLERPDRRRWRLWTRIPGETLDRCPGAAHARSAAALIARFHAALARLEHRYRPLGIVLHDTPGHLDELRAALRAHPDHPLRSAVLPLAEQIFEIAGDWPSLEHLPRRAAHGDLKFNNVLFQRDSDRAHALIDLDTVGLLPLFAELGDAWRSWCNRLPDDQGRAELDLGIWRAAAASYLDRCELDLSPAEIASLAEGIERISVELASRFAADVLYERYFAWDADRFTRSGEQQLRRARSQLDLHRQARETRAERLAFLTG